MKSILVVALLTISLFGNNYKEFAKKVNYEIDYKVALQKAKEEKKDLMLFMVANFCPWCIKFEKLVLKKERYNKMIHKKYIPVIINREEKNFPKKFDTPIVPTAYFVDYKTEEIKEKVVGYANRAVFIDIISK